MVIKNIKEYLNNLKNFQGEFYFIKNGFFINFKENIQLGKEFFDYLINNGFKFVAHCKINEFSTNNDHCFLRIYDNNPLEFSLDNNSQSIKNEIKIEDIEEFLKNEKKIINFQLW